MLKDVLFACALSMTLSICVFATEENSAETVVPLVSAPISGEEVEKNATKSTVEEDQPEVLGCGYKKKPNDKFLACCGEETEEETTEEAQKQPKVAGCGCKDKDKNKKLLAHVEETEKTTSVVEDVDMEKEELACIKCGGKHKFLAAADELVQEPNVVNPDLIEEVVQAA